MDDLSLWSGQDKGWDRADARGENWKHLDLILSKMRPILPCKSAVLVVSRRSKKCVTESPRESRGRARRQACMVHLRGDTDRRQVHISTWCRRRLAARPGDEWYGWMTACQSQLAAQPLANDSRIATVWYSDTLQRNARLEFIHIATAAVGSTLSDNFLERKSFSFMGVQLKFCQPWTPILNTNYVSNSHS